MSETSKGSEGKSKATLHVVPSVPGQESVEQSKENLPRVHDVTILDIDKEGSIDLEADSDKSKNREIALEGGLGESKG